MIINIQREALLAPLNQIIGVVERKQTIPVLGNVFLKTDGTNLLLTTSDLEVEMRSECVADVEVSGEITLPAQKLSDICKALPDGSMINLKLADNKCILSSNKSKFSLSTLPASDFPFIDDVESYKKIQINTSDLQRMLKQTIFCMAVHDVRYFLNGLLLEVAGNKVRCVTADGHRLALSEADYENNSDINVQLLIPRKGIIELHKMIKDQDQPLTLNAGRNHIRVDMDNLSMTSKLIDGSFPDYESVIPLNMDNFFISEKDLLKRALSRVAILSNEQYRGVKLKISPNKLELIGHNPEQEQAEEIIEIKTEIDNVETAFNVNYLLDAANAIEGDSIEFSFKEALSSCLIKQPDQSNCRLVVMPLKL